MTKPASEEKLSGLHDDLATALAAAVKPEPILNDEGKVVGKKYNPAALNVARQFLKDNNISCAKTTRPMQEIIDNLPDFEDGVPGQLMN